MPNVFLAPNGRWSAHAQTGFVAAGGKLYTYQASTSIPKATYQDPAGTNPNPNPVILDSKGEANIYWADDILYRIVLENSSGVLIYTQDNYPKVGAGGSHIINNFNNRENLIRNPQFTFWENTASFTTPGLESKIASDWIFRRNNANATIAITRQTFTLGQTDVTNNPIYYLNYECTSAGAGGETFKNIGQDFKSVQTLANQFIMFGIWAKSSSLSQIVIVAEQFFGTGGSPSATVSTTIRTITLTNTWAFYKTPTAIVLPNVNGKTLGTNGDDALRITIRVPLNATANIDISNNLLQWGTTLTDFPYLNQEKDYQRVVQLINQNVAYTGDYKHTIRDVADPGWVLCNDGTIGNALSASTGRANDDTKALFEFIWNKIPNALAPIFDSSGNPVTRGADAPTDFYANRRLALTRTLGRVLGGAGAAGAFSMQFTASAATDLLTFGANHPFSTGSPLQVSNFGGALPAPLAPATSYYAIYISATTIKVATTFTNADTGILINLTTDGTGIQTASFALTASALGEMQGEENHFQTTAELKQHLHDAPPGQAFVLNPGGSNIASGGGFSFDISTANTTNTGGNTAFSLIQPTTFVNIMIKL